jgi:tripartite-type tricarboxylate transporter receptor subunit TctC
MTKLENTAYTAETSSPDELRAFLKADSEQWGSVIKSTGIKIE